MYRYGMRLRGFAPLCQPMDGLVKSEIGGIWNGRYYHNFLYYDRELTDKEIRAYELDYLGDEDGEI